VAVIMVTTQTEICLQIPYINRVRNYQISIQ
jgi:hypothetical protein